jgi:hypothetical protein
LHEEHSESRMLFLLLSGRQANRSWTAPGISDGVKRLRNEINAYTKRRGAVIRRGSLPSLGAPACRVSGGGEANGCRFGDALCGRSVGRDLPGDRYHRRLRFGVDCMAIARAAKKFQGLNDRLPRFSFRPLKMEQLTGSFDGPQQKQK